MTAPLTWTPLTTPVAGGASDHGRVRPRYDDRVERSLGSLLDSLVTATGHTPRQIRVGRSPMSRGHSRGDEIMLADLDRRTLLHEYGHSWSVANQNPARAIADSLSFNPYTRQGGERLADLFADAWDAYAEGRLARSVGERLMLQNFRGQR